MTSTKNCPRCNAPFWYFTGVNTARFECGADAQISSAPCKYAAKQQERIQRLEEELMDAKDKHAVLVADVALCEDKGERIKRLEEENDALRADLLLWNEKEVKQ